MPKKKISEVSAAAAAENRAQRLVLYNNQAYWLTIAESAVKKLGDKGRSAIPVEHCGHPFTWLRGAALTLQQGSSSDTAYETALQQAALLQMAACLTIHSEQLHLKAQHFPRCSYLGAIEHAVSYSQHWHFCEGGHVSLVQLAQKS